MLDTSVMERMIEESGVSYKKSAVSYIFDCPRCSKKDKLYLRRRDGRFICFYCAEIDGFRGKPEYALSELLGKRLDDVRKALYGLGDAKATLFFDPGLMNPDDQDIDEEDSSIAHIPVPYPPNFYSLDDPKAKRGLDYLEGRGIPLSVGKEYDLRYCPEDRRVIFPVKLGSTPIGWQARSVIPTEYYDDTGKKRNIPKILTSKGLLREYCVMFQNRLEGSEHCILTEGPLDALKVHYAGGNVATMGKIVAATQLKLIRSYGIRKLYIGLDPDAEAEVGLIANQMADLELYRLLPPKGMKDLGEMDISMGPELLASAERIRIGSIFVFLKS